MRPRLILLVGFLFAASCASSQPTQSSEATNDETVEAGQTEQPTPAEAEQRDETQVVSDKTIEPAPTRPSVGRVQVKKRHPHTPPLPQKTDAKNADPDWGCEVPATTPAIKKHLGLDYVGPTSSEVTVRGKPGFVRFEQGQGNVVAYVCERWSADSDESDGSVVQIVEIAEISAQKSRVIWSSKPHLGSGNMAYGKLGGDMVTHVDIGDYDGDGKADVSFASIGHGRPSATVRMSDATKFVAMLPEGPANYDLCRPRDALTYWKLDAGTEERSPTKDVPKAVKAALQDAYLTSAECPDAE